MQLIYIQNVYIFRFYSIEYCCYVNGCRRLRPVTRVVGTREIHCTISSLKDISVFNGNALKEGTCSKWWLNYVSIVKYCDFNVHVGTCTCRCMFEKVFAIRHVNLEKICGRISCKVTRLRRKNHRPLASGK